MGQNMLNSPQENSLRITLFQAEEAVESLIELVGGKKNFSILTKVRSDLSTSDIDFILKELRELLVFIRELSGSFNLDLTPDVVDLRRRIRAATTVIWKDLEESKSDQLKRYGDVNEGLREALDPQLEKIIKKIMNIWLVVEKQRRNA